MQRQAAALGVPLVTRGASWDDYEAAFLDALAELRDQLGVEVGVFGDIDLQPHRDWVERVCGDRRPRRLPAALARAAPRAARRAASPPA